MCVGSAASVAVWPPVRPNKTFLISTDQLREEKSSFPTGQGCARCVPLDPGSPQDICGLSFVSSAYVRTCPPLLIPQQTTARHTGQPGSDSVASQANISPLCLHGNMWPSLDQSPSICLKVSLHTRLVYTDVVMAPESVLLHRYNLIHKSHDDIKGRKAFKKLS